MNIISKKNWNEVTFPEFLCRLPISVKSVEKKLGFDFTEIIEDGLGNTYSAFISVGNDVNLLLKGYIDKENTDPGLVIQIKSFEPNPKLCLEIVEQVFHVRKEDMVEIGKYLKPPRYLVAFKKEENILDKTFHNERSAHVYAKKIRSKYDGLDYEINDLEKQP